MLNAKWQRISAAKALLRLADHATLKEIKAAYRKLCKEHHPDLAADADQSVIMQEVNAAYAALLDYCAGYRFPLVPPPEGSAGMDPEDWWLDRFGEDPLWGRKREK